MEFPWKKGRTRSDLHCDILWKTDLLGNVGAGRKLRDVSIIPGDSPGKSSRRSWKETNRFNRYLEDKIDIN